MADVSIDAIVDNATALGMRTMVFTSDLIGYMFYADTGKGLAYSKTTDGGATWGTSVQVSTATTSILAFDVWFDQWTPGDSGTLIHCTWFEATLDDLFWRTVNTSGDGLGTQRVVFAGSTFVAGRGIFASVTKTISGYLYVAYDGDAGVEKGLFRSTDSGTSWSASLSSTFIEATIDQCWLFPASNTGDNNDCWAIYHDASADALTLKMWDSSAGSATESATIAAVIENVTNLLGQYPISATVRHSDGHLLISVLTDRDTATADHLVYDVNGTGSITALTAITTDIDDHYHSQIFIDNDTSDIYVAYRGKRDGSEVIDTTSKVYYTKSTDDGTSWSAGDTAYQEGATDTGVQIYAPLMGNRFFVAWRGVGTTIVGNFVNSVDLSGGGGPPPSSTYTDTLPFLGVG